MTSIARRATLTLAVTLLVMLAGCSGSSTPGSYKDAGLRRSFVEGCETQASLDGIDQPAPYCRCSYDELSDTIEFSEFKSVHERLSEAPGPLPREWQEVIAACET